MPFPTSVDAIVDAPPITAATVIHASQVIGPQRVTVGPVWLNVLSDDLGGPADPTGATDSTTAIQARLNSVRIAGGGIVYMPPGTYLVNTATRTGGFSQGTALMVGANTTLMGAGRDATTIRL